MKIRKLTAHEKQAIKSLVKAMCADYNKHYDSCPHCDDYGCVMFYITTTAKLCPIFQKRVLPLNPKLEAVFFPKPTKTCKICGNPFSPVHGQAYCSDFCRADGKRIGAAQRMRTYRAKQRSSVTIMAL